MEISDKTLAWLVIATIIVSIGGTIISLNGLNQIEITGHYVSNVTGTTNVSITSQTLLRFAVSSVDFGSGQVNASAPYQCNLTVNTTTGTVTSTSLCSGFNTTVAGGTFQLENAGNTIMNLTLNFSKNATNFIGGGAGTPACGGSGCPAPIFKFQVYNNETASCTTPNATTLAWTDVVENASVPVCTGLKWQDANDSLLIGVMVGIPSDATGSKGVSILAQGTG